MFNSKKMMMPLVAAGFLATACLHSPMHAQKVALETAAEGIPAAEGEIRTMDAANDNTRIWVKVAHLAPPQKVAEGATTYVVWAQPQGGENVQNIGALQVDKKLNGSLMTVLPYENFKLFITAEPSGQVTQPSGEELLAANVPTGGK